MTAAKTAIDPDLFALPGDAGDAARAAAEHVVAQLEEAQRLYREHPAPKLGVRLGDDDASVVLVCPWCRESLVENRLELLDIAFRDTGHSEVLADHRVVLFVYDTNSAEYDALAVQTSCCKLPVSLPEGWDIGDD